MPLPAWHNLIERLLGKGVVLTPFTGVWEVSENSVDVYNVITWEPRTIEGVDTVVLAAGGQVDDALYHIKDAVMIPRPIQRPRPPIAIGALGPVMLKNVARYADIWNSISHAETLEGQLEETRDRIRILDEHCAAVGRDPAAIRRSYVLLDKPSRDASSSIPYYASTDVFIEMVHRFKELGISEFMLDYPVVDNEREMFEKIAKDVIPELKR